MDFIRHMRRSAFFPGRPGGMITEITWIVGKSEVICEWLSDERRKTLEQDLDFFNYEICLSLHFI